tara:strand:+ start:1142 stop:1840 length:699 start_codon:yes stop_codon:yes gene_type:complete
MDALILAAGRGTRLGLDELPKCLINFGKSSLIEYQIKCLKKMNIKKIFVVTGYNAKKIQKKLKESVSYIHNEEFATTNNIYSILKAENFLTDDFVCIYGDLFFDEKILKSCIESKDDITLMIEKNLREETTRVKIDNNEIVMVNKDIDFDKADGNFIGMMKCSKNVKEEFFKNINQLAKNNSQAYYTIAFESMIKNGKKINFDVTNGLSWTDIDTDEDLRLAKEMFSEISVE